MKKVKRSVLGRSILAAAQEDATMMQLPSWVNAVPPNFGSAAQGKLSADNWRTLCTINLPVTLICLWGDRSPDSRERQMLDNFMDLVTAVEVGSMLVTSENHIQIYERHMTKYLTDLKELYKERRVAPNHHLALHIGDFLRLFGPVHSWRAFALERYNYLLQRINTNRRFGQFREYMI